MGRARKTIKKIVIEVELTIEKKIYRIIAEQVEEKGIELESYYGRTEREESILELDSVEDEVRSGY